MSDSMPRGSWVFQYDAVISVISIHVPVDTIGQTDKTVLSLEHFALSYLGNLDMILRASRLFSG